MPVLTGDDEAALAARVLAAEHRIYPMALAWLAEGRVRLTVRRLDGGAVPPEEASSEAVEIAGAGSPFTVGRPPVLIVPGGSRSDAD